MDIRERAENRADPLSCAVNYTGDGREAFAHNWPAVLLPLSPSTLDGLFSRL